MDRDRAFWSVVSALAFGTILLTTYSCWSPAVGRSADAEERLVRPAAVERERPAPAPSAAPVDQATAARSAAPSESARPDRAAVRASLADYVRTIRERNRGAGGSDTKLVDDGSRTPLVEMEWPQYRAWVKVADALAKRDYRSTERLLTESQDALGTDLTAAMMDALVDDYRQYLDEVIETQCQGQEPQSVWRKTIYMALLLAKHERLSPPLERAAQDAQLACGF